MQPIAIASGNVNNDGEKKMFEKMKQDISTLKREVASLRFNVAASLQP